MKFKYSTTSIALVLIALAAISATAVQQDVFAQSLGMSVTATAEKGSDTISVNGHTMLERDITFKVTSPSGSNVVDAKQTSPSADGSFDVEFRVGDLWKENGFYSITAKQADSSLYTMTVFVEVTDGILKETSVTESNLENGMFAQQGGGSDADRGLSIEANAVVGSTTIGITGMTDKTSMDVTVIVTAPNGNISSAGQVSPSLDGSFAMDVELSEDSPIWKQDGDYVVSAQQGENPAYRDSFTVEIEDGRIIPEFGAIAAMILAVAIISIIAVSARSRLSIMPRY